MPTPCFTIFRVEENSQPSKTQRICKDRLVIQLSFGFSGGATDLTAFSYDSLFPYKGGRNELETTHSKQRIGNHLLMVWRRLGK